MAIVIIPNLAGLFNINLTFLRKNDQKKHFFWTAKLADTVKKPLPARRGREE
jgi:hypothetical protein